MPGDHRLVDTNILVHAYTVSDERKHWAAVALVEPVWGGQPAATTLQNLCEFFVVVTRKVAKPLSPAEAQVIVEGGAGRVPVARDRSRPRDGAQAIGLVKAYRASFWDALIAACMLEHGVPTTVTENEADFRKIPGITVLNPFKTGVRPS